MEEVNALEQSKYFKLIKDRREREKSRPKVISEEDRKLRTKQWCTFYRRNLNIYVEHRLGIKLKFFQHIMLYLMSMSSVFVAICSRGLSKTYTTALYSISESLLRPNMEIVITSSVIDQANIIIQEKIVKEIINKHSDVLKYFYEQEMIKVRKPGDTYEVTLWNGSSIKSLPALDSSRGARACLIIAEETRLIPKKIWDSVFTKMLRPRRAEFLDNTDIYDGDKRLLEDGREIYISSAHLKSEWFWTTFKNAVSNCFNRSRVKSNFFAGDIFVAMHHGLKNESDLIKSKTNSGELEFRMEDLNEMIGETEDAYFTLDMVHKNQVIDKAFHPPTIEQFNGNVDLKNRKKKTNEYRLVCVDLAFTKDIKGTARKDEADNCVLECLSLEFGESRNKRRLEHIETHAGGNEDLVLRRIRELFFDYQADFIVLD